MKVADVFVSLHPVSIDMTSSLCHRTHVGCCALVNPFPKGIASSEAWYPEGRCNAALQEILKGRLKTPVKERR